MARIIVMGGGFGGISALVRLAHHGHQISLIDSKEKFDFMPMLPEMVSLRISADGVSVPYAELAEKYGFEHIHDRVEQIDPAHNIIETGSGQRLNYDYAILATGAHTDYHGNQWIAEHALGLHQASQAQHIIDELEKRKPANVVVVGGGNTGVEVASALVRLKLHTGLAYRITIVNYSATILANLDPWVRHYVRSQLEEMGVVIRNEMTVKEIDDGATLTNGDRIEDAVVIWNAGVRVEAPIAPDAAVRDRAGRLVVDRELRITSTLYAIGDAAHVETKSNSHIPLAMTSFYAIEQGKAAADNVLRASRGQAPKLFHPVNYGYVIPLANGKGCGKLFGIPLRGRLANWAHHGVSWFRALDSHTRRLQEESIWREGLGL